ncbi:hypothetical protein Taro_035280, partial [Colocasia esculenta]|nr:hypothetical protein [Colocasia esculenta]
MLFLASPCRGEVMNGWEMSGGRVPKRRWADGWIEFDRRGAGADKTRTKTGWHEAQRSSRDESGRRSSLPAIGTVQDTDQVDDDDEVADCLADDSVHHLDHFQGQVEMVNVTDALKCRAFMSTLDDAALQWFKALPAQSIPSFADLAQRFLDHFYNTVQHSLCADDQRENEMFRDYAKRFQVELLGNSNDRWRGEPRVSSGPSEKRPRREETRRDSEGRRESSQRPDEYRRVRDLPRFGRLPSEILPVIKKLPEFRRPEPIARPPSGRGADLYCEYHKSYGHLTDQCRSLKMEIAEMLRRGIIGKDVIEGKPKDHEPEENHEREGKGAVLVLAGGSASGGDNGRKRKAYASAVVLGVSSSTPSLKEVITFSAEDAVGLSFPHDGALVIHADIDRYTVHHILVDNGAAPDVLFYDCFLKMTNLSTELKPVSTPLFGFSGMPVTAEGS